MKQALIKALLLLGAASAVAGDSASESLAQFKAHYSKMRSLIRKMANEGPSRTQSERQRQLDRVEAAKRMLIVDQQSEQESLEALRAQEQRLLNTLSASEREQLPDIRKAMSISQKNLKEIDETLGVADQEIARLRARVKSAKPESVEDEQFRLLPPVQETR